MFEDLCVFFFFNILSSLSLLTALRPWAEVSPTPGSRQAETSGPRNGPAWQTQRLTGNVGPFSLQPYILFSPEVQGYWDSSVVPPVFFWVCHLSALLNACSSGWQLCVLEKAEALCHTDSLRSPCGWPWLCTVYVVFPAAWRCPLMLAEGSAFNGHFSVPTSHFSGIIFVGMQSQSRYSSSHEVLLL